MIKIGDVMVEKSMSLIETHAHLTFPEFDKDRDEVLNRAWEAGVEAIVTIGAGDGLDGNQRAVDFAQKHDHIYATVGVHPHDAETVDTDAAIAILKKLSDHPKVVAIGEIGLDYFRKHSSEDSQRQLFRRLLEMAYEVKMPVSIHDRDAHHDMIYMLREMRHNLIGGIFHCFSGDVSLAQEVIEMGFYIAIPGVVTFKKADVIKEVVKNISLDHIVLETDCPYFAPEPHRGKRNEPAYLVQIAEEIAKLTGLSSSDVGRITSMNARRAYNLPGMVPLARIAYPIRRSLYLNITNRCTLACTFCPKQSGSFEVKGHNLKLKNEPSVEDVFRAIGEFEGYNEVVFCGYGEPTLRLELLKVVAGRIKEQGVRVRLDTDGLVNLVHDRDVLPELKGLVDAVSDSMNAPDAQTYKKICPNKYGDKAFFAMLSFLDRASQFIPEVTASVVGLPDLNVRACEKLASQMGVDFRLRTYQELG